MNLTSMATILLQRLELGWNLYFLVSGLGVASVVEMFAFRSMCVWISNVWWESHVKVLPFDIVWGTVEDTTMFVYRQGGDDPHVIVSYEYANISETWDDNRNSVNLQTVLMDELFPTRSQPEPQCPIPNGKIWKRYSRSKLLYREIHEPKKSTSKQTNDETTPSTYATNITEHTISADDTTSQEETTDGKTEIKTFPPTGESSALEQLQQKKAHVELWLYRGYPQSAMPRQAFFRALRIGADAKLFPPWTRPFRASLIGLTGCLLHCGIARLVWSRLLGSSRFCTLLKWWLVYPTPLCHFLYLVCRRILWQHWVVFENSLHAGEFDSIWLKAQGAQSGEYASGMSISIGTVVR